MQALYLRVFAVIALANNYERMMDEDTGEPLRRGQIYDQEVNLLYVAATRAKRALRINAKLTEWLRFLGIDPRELNERAI